MHGPNATQEPWVSHLTGLKAQVQDLVLSHSSRLYPRRFWPVFGVHPPHGIQHS